MNIIQAKRLNVLDAKLNHMFQNTKDMRGKNEENSNTI